MRGGHSAESSAQMRVRPCLGDEQAHAWRSWRGVARIESFARGDCCRLTCRIIKRVTQSSGTRAASASHDTAAAANTAATPLHAGLQRQPVGRSLRLFNRNTAAWRWLFTAQGTVAAVYSPFNAPTRETRTLDTQFAYPMYDTSFAYVEAPSTHLHNLLEAHGCHDRESLCAVCRCMRSSPGTGWRHIPRLGLLPINLDALSSQPGPVVPHSTAPAGVQARPIRQTNSARPHGSRYRSRLWPNGRSQ